MARPYLSLLALLFLFCFPLILRGQDGMKAFRQGYEAHRNGSYKEAIRFYGRAIEANDSLKKAYYNRASVRIALGRYEKAKKDLDRTLKLDPDYLPAYYNRANIHTEKGNYERAEKDLSLLLERDPKHEKALILRGQVRQRIGKGEAGCRDLEKAKQLGAPKAFSYIERFCGPDPLELEARWPTPKGWKVVRRNENEDLKRIELIPNDESFPEWDHLGSVTALKHVRNIPMDTARHFLTRQAKGKCQDVKAYTLEKRDRGNEPYIFFTLHCSSHINTKEAETQLWYVEQGKRHLYAYFVAVRKKRMSQEEEEKWMAFFR